MSEMQIFSSARFGTIRTTEINGQPWFCLADVCKPLGLQSYHCKDRLKSDGLVSTEGTDSMGRTQMMTFIDEGNLYRTIFQSNKPEAEPFISWVTEEVLPTLRKTGSYSTHRRVPEVSPGGLADLIRVTRRVTLDAGSTPQDVGYMVKSVYASFDVPVPLSLEKQCPGQICIAGMLDVLPMQVPAVE